MPGPLDNIREKLRQKRMKDAEAAEAIYRGQRPPENRAPTYSSFWMSEARAAMPVIPPAPVAPVPPRAPAPLNTERVETKPQINQADPSTWAALAVKLDRVRDLPGVFVTSYRRSYYDWTPCEVWEIPDWYPIARPRDNDVRPDHEGYMEGGAYFQFAPMQRWQYLDWVAGEPVQAPVGFYRMRVRGLIQACQIEEGQRLTKTATLLEEMAPQVQDYRLEHEALSLLLRAYVTLGRRDDVLRVFPQAVWKSDVLEALHLLNQHNMPLNGGVLLAVAKTCGFNFTEVTRRYFDEIAAEAEQRLAEYERKRAPLLSKLPSIGYGEIPLISTFANTVVEIVREAQTTVRDLHRGMRKTDRMTTAEKATEEEHLAGMTAAISRDVQVRNRYAALPTQPELAPVYLRSGAQSLVEGNYVMAVAYLRRAAELQPSNPAAALLKQAEVQLAAAPQ